MDQERNNIRIEFQPVPPNLVNINNHQVEVGPIQPTNPEIEHPKFGPRWDAGSLEFDFHTKVEWRPLKLNLEKEARLSWEQQSHFINLIYSNQEVFSLHDEDFSYILYWLQWISLSTYCTIQYPDNYRVKYANLDSWLCQGIIWPSQSLYASEVVIVHNKLGEICLCIDYHKLDSIMLGDVFPLPQVDKALQAVHCHNWISSFDLIQGYLQLAMEEDDIKKIAFRARVQTSTSSLACLFFCLTQAVTFVISLNNV